MPSALYDLRAMTYETSEQIKKQTVIMAKELSLAQVKNLETLLESLQENAER